MPQERWPQRLLNALPHPNLPRPVILILAGLVLALGLWLPLALWLPGGSGDLTVGQPSPVSIRAPQSAEYESEVLTREARTQAANNIDNIVYTTDFELPAQQRTQLSALLGTITNIRDDPSLSSMEKRESLVELPSASVVLTDTVAEAIVSLDDTAWDEVSSKSVSLYDWAIQRYESEIDQTTLQTLLETELPPRVNRLPQPQRDLVMLFTRSFLRVNHTLDEALTEQQKQAASDAVEAQMDRVQEGQIIVRDGEIVTPLMLERLEVTEAMPRSISGLDMAGYALIASLLALLTMLYLVFMQGDIVEHPRPLFVIIGLIIVTVGTARFLAPLWPDYPFIFPMATVILVLAVVFNSHLALAGATLLSVVIGVLFNNSLELATVMLAGSVVAVLSVRGAEKRLAFMLAGGTIALSTMACQFGFWLVSTTDLRLLDVGNIAFLSAVNGSLSAVLALGLFNIVGHVAGVVTPLQLMELAHPSQPIIRKLMREAPGTYYHSVSVGNLAEAAAELINADALLLRVAAYYHDIGKTIRPYFFTDNQTGRENVHNELDPQTSAAIIIDHVREGLKMARAAGLPQPIIDFIATHHGTSVVGHFYQQALREQDTVEIDDFRYPGPSPFTREQGIMMLADSVEATVRSKAQHGLLLAKRAGNGNGHARGGGQTLEEMVGGIIDERVRSGQLDNTSLTLHDLVLIRQAFVTSLQGIYHPRVEYGPQVVKA